MSTLQIKIEDKNILDRLKFLAESKGLSMTSYARMKLYEEANAMNQDIEAGLKDYRDGNVSPEFANTKDAVFWLNS